MVLRINLLGFLRRRITTTGSFLLSSNSWYGGIGLAPPLAISLNQLFQLRQTVDHVDPTATIQLGRL